MLSSAVEVFFYKTMISLDGVKEYILQEGAGQVLAQAWYLLTPTLIKAEKSPGGSKSAK